MQHRIIIATACAILAASAHAENDIDVKARAAHEAELKAAREEAAKHPPQIPELATALNPQMIKLETSVRAVGSQRDGAFDQVAACSGEVAADEARIHELEDKVKALVDQLKPKKASGQ